MEKTIMMVGNILLLVVENNALILQKHKREAGIGVYWSGVCGCHGWGRPGTAEDTVAKEHGLRLYTGESYGVKDIFGETAFVLDELVPLATEEQIRAMASVEAQ